VNLSRPETFDDLRRRRWQLLALSSVGAFMGPLDGSIVAVALPAIGADLDLSFSVSLWVQAVYLLTMAVLLIPLGRLADHHGRVRFYLIGIAIFTVGSLLAALSVSGGWLIGSRVVQAVGAALLSATAAAIVVAVFPREERGRALGINVAAVYLGLSVGPPLGGFLADGLGWRWIFLVNLPVGLVILLWGWRLMPRTERATARAPRPDVTGAALLAVALSALLVPLTFAGQWGWSSSSTLGLLALSVVAFAAFVATERRVRDPVVDLDLLRHNRLFAAANGAALLNYLALTAVGVLTVVYLQIVQGRSATETGWILLAQPLMQATLSPLSGRLSDRVGSRLLTTTGMLLTAAGMTLLATLGEDTGMAAVLAMLGLVGVGMASFSAPNASAIMGSVAPRELGLASAFLATMRVTGQALSVAVLGGIAASQLGRVGGRLLFSSARSGELAVSAERIADDYLRGYRYAMLTGAALALVGAAVSLTRGAHKPAGEGAEGPAGERVPAPVAGERAVAGDGGEPATAGGGGADAPTGDAGGRRPPGVRGEG
jgi:EmrB/QacA subfamily drug resistance transporter